MNATTYKYTMEMEYINGNTSIKIDPKMITNMVIDYDYDNLNMPVIYATLSLNKKFIDDMINNTTKALISLTIYKGIENSPNTVNTVYFRDQFIYIIPDNLNQSDYLDYSGTNAGREDMFKTIVIGLMSLKNVNDNKTLTNTVINGTMINAIQYTTKHIKNMLIEPLDYNIPLKSLTIPPKSTVSNALKFLNNISVFYKTEYRFFLDFAGGYLLSRNGKPVQSKTEQIMSVIIDVGTIETDNKYFGVGMVTDMEKKAYIVPVVYGVECNTDIDKSVTEQLYTNINTISTSGTTANKDLDINNSEYNKSKTMYVRLGNDNTNKLSNISSAIESNRVVLSISKAGLDSTIFTPNKIYTVNNYAPLSKKDATGSFILVRKREQYNRESKYFAQNLYLTFKKVATLK